MERVYSTPKAMELHSALMAQVDAEVIEVAAPAFSSIAATESSQEILALVRPKTWTLPEVLRGQSLVVVLDGMQDPGNAGTIIRSSEAFGAGAAVLLKGCVPIVERQVSSRRGGFAVPLALRRGDHNGRVCAAG